MSRRRWALIAVVLVAALAASIAAGSSVIDSPPATTTTATPVPTPTAPAVPAGFVTFRDEAEGYTIAYPQIWERQTPSDDQVRLLAAEGSAVSMLIRVAPIGLDVTVETLNIARELTDSLVGADRRTKLLSEPEPVTLDGVPAYRYVYSYGKGGAHIHYFVFLPKRLLTLVFQVPSVRALQRDSDLLDRVAGTFRVTD